MGVGSDSAADFADPNAWLDLLETLEGTAEFVVHKGEFQAEDGESGLKLALDHKPDVVVCDLLMPRCNGFQFCRALNARRSLLPNVKIVVSSGSGYAIDRINALESGADEYVPKPVAADELLALLERLTSGKRIPINVKV